jgi:hypothetical protein
MAGLHHAYAHARLHGLECCALQIANVIAQTTDLRLQVSARCLFATQERD